MVSDRVERVFTTAARYDPLRILLSVVLFPLTLLGWVAGVAWVVASVAWAAAAVAFSEVQSRMRRGE